MSDKLQRNLVVWHEGKWRESGVLPYDTIPEILCFLMLIEQARALQRLFFVEYV